MCSVAYNFHSIIFAKDYEKLKIFLLLFSEHINLEDLALTSGTFCKCDLIFVSLQLYRHFSPIFMEIKCSGRYLSFLVI